MCYSYQNNFATYQNNHIHIYFHLNSITILKSHIEASLIIFIISINVKFYSSWYRHSTYQIISKCFMIKETNFKNKQFSEAQEKLAQTHKYRSKAPQNFPLFLPLCFILLIEIHMFSSEIYQWFLKAEKWSHTTTLPGLNLTSFTH